FSRIGPNDLHGSHQVAQKSTRTGVSIDACSTCASKVCWSMSKTWAVAASVTEDSGRNGLRGFRSGQRSAYQAWRAEPSGAFTKDLRESADRPSGTGYPGVCTCVRPKRC